MVSDYLTGHEVRREYTEQRKLGSGSDGCVVLYRHNSTAQGIAVKFPRVREAGDQELIDKHLVRAQRELRSELNTLRSMSPHENLVSLLGYDHSWQPHGPALFVEYCSLGDAHTFRCELKVLMGGRIPEETIWKLFSDMVEALSFLHGEDLIHGDLKPENILVSAPPDFVPTRGEFTLPLLPVFKLADFSRASLYDPGYQPGSTYNGTWAYAPPLEEQKMEITPASDIWSLGGVVQWYAYGRLPVLPTDAFKNEAQARGLNVQDLIKLGSGVYKKEWRVIYRPINIGVKEQMNDWLVPEKDVMNVPYSDELNKWYAMCMIQDMHMRTTSSFLKQSFVEVAERQIRVLTSQRLGRRIQELGEEMSASADDDWGAMVEEPDMPVFGYHQGPHSPLRAFMEVGLSRDPPVSSPEMDDLVRCAQLPGVSPAFSFQMDHPSLPLHQHQAPYYPQPQEYRCLLLRAPQPAQAQPDIGFQPQPTQGQLSRNFHPAEAQETTHAQFSYEMVLDDVPL